MLLQITVVPPPDIFSPLVALGEGLGKLFNPRGRQKQAFLNLVAQDSELLANFRIAQEQAEAQFQARTPDITTPAEPADIEARPPLPNVLEAFGFNPEETERILKASPETLAQQAEAEGLRQGLGRIRARGQVALAVAEVEEAEAILALGIPKLRAEILSRTLNLEDAQAIFDTKEFRVFEMMIKSLTFEERRLLDFSKFELDFAKLITERDIATIRAAAAASTGLEKAGNLLDLAAQYDKIITGIIKECREAPDNQTLNLCVERVNEMARRRVRDLPDATFAMLAEVDERWLRRNRINIRVFTPDSILAAVQDGAVDLVEAGGSVEEVLLEILKNPETNRLWTQLTEEERDLWKGQLAFRARIGKADSGPPITEAEQNELADQALRMLEGPGVSGDIARALLIFGLVGQLSLIVVRRVAAILNVSLEQIRTSADLIKFLNSPQGKRAISGARQRRETAELREEILGTGPPTPVPAPPQPTPPDTVIPPEER